MNRKQSSGQEKHHTASMQGAAAIVQQLFDEAVRHHQAGRLSDAERLYRQVLSSNPNHADSLNLLGVLACQVGRQDAGVDLIGRAIKVDGRSVAYHFNLGNAFRDVGREEEAVACFRRALELEPDFVDAHNNLGNALRDLGRLDEAVASYCRAVDLKPNYALALANLGGALQELGRLDEAVDCCRRALDLDPNYVEALITMGVSLKDLGQLEGAIGCFRSALGLKPDNAEALNNLGAALLDWGQSDEAMYWIRRALDLKPNYPQGISNMGFALQNQGRLDEAVVCCRKAIELKPDFSDAYNILGSSLHELGRREEAATCFRRAIALKPDSPEGHFNHGLSLLLEGRYEEGWEEYEWRWRCSAFRRQHRKLGGAEWDGSNLAGCMLLLWPEQGFGDTIQFVRYAEVMAEAGAKVIIEVPRPLARLLATVPGIAGVVVKGEPLPPFDLHLPMMSAPHVMRTTLATIPARVPYLYPETAAVEHWRCRLEETSGLPGRPKVGLVWAGDARLHNPRASAIDKRRSIALAAVEPLLRVPEVAFVSLQKGAPAEQIAAMPRELRPLDLMGDVDDFADTAALIANLDLVISVDTSVAHLAGALGKPVWILSRFDGCWRWLRDREDSPWYPTARLFRQPRPGDWQPVVDKVRAALRHFAENRLSSTRT